jgi:antitoxin component HigA of HigAB toxin-antitoxin module
MNKPQFIKSPSGDELVVLPRAEYDELVRIAEEAAEDAADVAIYDARKADMRGSEPIPLEVSRHVLKGTGLLKAFRLWRGLSQTELAERSGTSQGYISDIESRRRKLTEDTATRLAATLDIPDNWLI